MEGGRCVRKRGGEGQLNRSRSRRRLTRKEVLSGKFRRRKRQGIGFHAEGEKGKRWRTDHRGRKAVRQDAHGGRRERSSKRGRPTPTKREKDTTSQKKSLGLLMEEGSLERAFG